MRGVEHGFELLAERQMHQNADHDVDSPHPVSMETLLAAPESLLPRLEDPLVRVVDCRDIDEYKKDHIVGVVPIAFDYWLKAPDDAGNPRGTHLLDVARLNQLMRTLGISRDTHVMLYDDDDGKAAARLWWVLRYLGHHSVSVLNGGWTLWTTSDKPVESIQRSAPRSSFEGQPDKSLIATIDDVVQAINNENQIIDARSRQEWTGEDAHGNKRGGRIPGAKHLDWQRLLTSRQPREFLPRQAIQKVVKDAGIATEKRLITYCQAGVRAAHMAFSLSLAGYEWVQVYDGSMKEWSNRFDTPLEIGI